MNKEGDEGKMRTRIHIKKEKANNKIKFCYSLTGKKCCFLFRDGCCNFADRKKLECEKDTIFIISYIEVF